MSSIIEIDYFDFCMQISEEHSEPSQTSKMEAFAEIVNGWKMWTIIAKSSILDV